jgi:hypothetical protein
MLQRDVPSLSYIANESGVTKQRKNIISFLREYEDGAFVFEKIPKWRELHEFETPEARIARFKEKNYENRVKRRSKRQEKLAYLESQLELQKHVVLGDPMSAALPTVEEMLGTRTIEVDRSDLLSDDDDDVLSDDDEDEEWEQSGDDDSADEEWRTVAKEEKRRI